MTIFSFFLGLVIGSFLNVVIRRGARGENFRGRSHCESCGITLSVTELIPVLSFLIQKGRCRYCHAAFSWQYLLVELGTAFSYAMSAWIFLPNLPLDKHFFLLATGLFFGIGAAIVIFVSDIRSQIIPNGAVLTLLILGLFRPIYVMFQTESGTIVPDSVWNIGTALVIALFLALLWFFSKGRWMGFGDVKLILATSLILGYPSSVAALLFAFWLGGIIGVILIISRVKTLKEHIPFGPFILVGTVLAYFLPQNFFYITALTDLFSP